MRKPVDVLFLEDSEFLFQVRLTKFKRKKKCRSPYLSSELKKVSYSDLSNKPVAFKYNLKQ